MAINETPAKGYQCEYVNKAGDVLVRAVRALESDEWWIHDEVNYRSARINAGYGQVKVLVGILGDALDRGAALKRAPRTTTRLGDEHQDARWTIRGAVYSYNEHTDRWTVEGSGIRHELSPGFEPWTAVDVFTEVVE